MPPVTATPEPVTAGATIWPVTAAELGRSWRPGCPVGPAQLRRVQIDHIGSDARTHRGELIVHEELVAQVIVVFEQLYHLGYPIEKMRPVGDY
ncbi:MAG: M15 family peptidase, partial [Mycobacterium sp.]